MYPTQFYRKGNSEIIEVAGLLNEVTGAYVNNANVSVDIVDAVSLAVVLASQPMPYVAASNGTYRYVTANTLGVTDGQALKVRITVAGAAYWEIPVQVGLRT